MKKYTIFIIALALALTLGACSDDDSTPVVTPSTEGTFTDADGSVYGWVRIGNLDWMKAEFDAMVDYVKSSPAPDPVNNPVLTPGEPERLRMADRLANGVEISDGEMAAILNVCQAAGVHHHWEVI